MNEHLVINEQKELSLPRPTRQRHQIPAARAFIFLLLDAAAAAAVHPRPSGRLGPVSRIPASAPRRRIDFRCGDMFQKPMIRQQLCNTRNFS